MNRDVGVRRVRHGFRHSARSISSGAPIAAVPFTDVVTNTASLIFRPENGLTVLILRQSFVRPMRSFGSSSSNSRSRQSCADSLRSRRRRPPGNIQRPSIILRTSRMRRSLMATSLDDLVIVLSYYRKPWLRKSARRLLASSRPHALVASATGERIERAVANKRQCAPTCRSRERPRSARRARYFGCPAASRISAVISSGREINDK